MDAQQADKYSRQILFAGLGRQGQETLLRSKAVIAGCGALGTVAANLLVRSGVGRVRIIDRDFVELSNLQRQTLFEESDARDALPKAVAAEKRLRAVNSDVNVEGVVADMTPENAVELLTGFDVILDATDNFETRMLINDAAVALNIPWVYTAAVGSYGVTMSIIPQKTACLACVLEGEEGAPIASGAEPTCDTAGVLNAAASTIASIEAAEALKLLLKRDEAVHGTGIHATMISCDVWTGKFQTVRVSRNPNCRACARHELIYLAGEVQPHVTMCGRDAVQIHERHRALDLQELGRRLSTTTQELRNNDFLLRFRVSGYEMTVFADGRAIIKGTQDPSIARSLYARYVGA
jgi:molybdopterin/thiamine biosynthesis adenylyltransferase